MRAVTRAAEGFDRRAFTVAEILRMQETGILSEDENFELIEGEIVPRQAKNHIHELLKTAILYNLIPCLPENLWFGTETSIYLDGATFVEPDLSVFPRGMRLDAVKGLDIVLAIEVAATSIAYDREFKAGLYARHRFQEYWVVDANTRETHQFADPRGKTWRRRDKRGPDDALTHPALPGFSIRLSDY